MSQLHSSQAQAQVLATTELLELICLCFDPKQLFAAQRVCQSWNALIKSSQRLQERMFLRAPSTTRQIPPHIPPSSNEQTINPQDTYHDSSPDITLCPILEIATQFVRTHPEQIAASCTQSALRGSPSWHQMLLTIPPCKEATVALWWRIGDSMRGSVYLECVRNPEGLRFADVVKAAFEQKAGNWKAMPDGELLPLSAGRDVTLDQFLGRRGGEVRMMDSTSVFFLRVP